jgi:hypothetical protein
MEKPFSSRSVPGLNRSRMGIVTSLWAELLMNGSQNGAARMCGLMELSDRFGRPLELERAFIGGVLKTPRSERAEDDEEVISRFQEALSAFEQRFPGASGL